jgi:hypothetical protein
MAGKFLGYKEAAGTALAWPHSGAGNSFYLVNCPVPLSDNLANFGQGYVFATANEGIVLISHHF